ncbi:hypothetical protein ANO14919_089250 [Xylariales sp. No.14919]|nr:hypothetical protein ANO14919_089250 [Xylariales sp. No.14919]
MGIDPIILAAFGSPSSDIDLSDDRRPTNDASVGLLLAVALISVVLRFTARINRKADFRFDDYAILIALIVYAYLYIYSASICFSKLSILAFYKRIFGFTGVLWRGSLYLATGLSVIQAIISWSLLANLCRPVSHYWNWALGAAGECMNASAIFLTVGTINIFVDVFVLGLPIPQVLKLQMPPRRKWQVCALFLLGSLACICSIIRVYFLTEYVNTADVTWAFGPLFISLCAETSIAILCACLPSLRPLFMDMWDKMKPIGEPMSRQSTGNRAAMKKFPRIEGSEDGIRLTAC